MTSRRRTGRKALFAIPASHRTARPNLSADRIPSRVKRTVIPAIDIATIEAVIRTASSTPLFARMIVPGSRTIKKPR
ncbi:MAG: hypothetical protein AMJ88_13030 [Anaerolineae bacterium SM23_ 63]|nr:MAG: hypothetical protein AMJ88_13030 [Anaerolineae bacterium SM23_ 63]